MNREREKGKKVKSTNSLRISIYLTLIELHELKNSSCFPCINGNLRGWLLLETSLRFMNGSAKNITHVTQLCNSSSSWMGLLTVCTKLLVVALRLSWGFQSPHGWLSMSLTLQPGELTTEPTSHLRGGSCFLSLLLPLHSTFPTISGSYNWRFRSWKISLWFPT